MFETTNQIMLLSHGTDMKPSQLFPVTKTLPTNGGHTGDPGDPALKGKSKRSPRCNCKRLAETCDPSGPITDPSGSIHSIPSIATFQPFWGAILALNSDCI